MKGVINEITQLVLTNIDPDTIMYMYKTNLTFHISMKRDEINEMNSKKTEIIFETVMMKKN